MNKLAVEDRARILYLFCEGVSIRAISRLTGTSKNTVSKLLFDAGAACAAYHDANMQHVKASRVQVDAIWSFNHAKQKNVATTKVAPEGAGNTWTWTAIDAASKMILSYLVGGGDSEYAKWFMDDLASRLASRVHLISDGHRVYLEAAEDAPWADVDYAQLVKLYGHVGDESADVRYSPAECTGIAKCRVKGNPDDAYVAASYLERQNLMYMRRFTPWPSAFSKRVENHAHAVALHMMHYNFIRIHKTLRVSPAMAAGVTDRLWDVADIALLVEAADAKPSKRFSYKKPDQG